MPKRASSINKARIFKKIAIARKFAEKMQKSKNTPNLNDFPLRLKEIADKIELTYNDVTVKRYKWQASSGMMRILEGELDDLLSKAGDIRSSKIRTELNKQKIQ